MKKIILIVAAVSLFAACSKKQADKPVVKVTPQTATVKDITGVWVLDVDSITTYANNQTNVYADTNTGGTTFTFNADGTGAEATTAFTYKLANGIISIQKSNDPNAVAIPFIIIAINTNQLIMRETQPNEIQDLVMHKN